LEKFVSITPSPSFRLRFLKISEMFFQITFWQSRLCKSVTPMVSSLFPHVPTNQDCYLSMAILFFSFLTFVFFFDSAKVTSLWTFCMFILCRCFSLFLSLFCFCYLFTGCRFFAPTCISNPNSSFFFSLSLALL